MKKPEGYTRLVAKHLNDQKRCLGALLGIAQGVLCDRSLVDEEIRFLDAWLKNNEEICQQWPGDILHRKIRDVLADGIITAAERTYLIEHLKKLIGADDITLASATHVTELVFDDHPVIQFNGATFCLTGDFVYGSREDCWARIEGEGGEISKSVTKNIHYLVVGSLGSPEWKHGSFGTKIERAMKYRNAGLALSIVRESHVF